MDLKTLTFSSMNRTSSITDLSKEGGAAGLYPGKKDAIAFGEDF